MSEQLCSVCWEPWASWSLSPTKASLPIWSISSAVEWDCSHVEPLNTTQLIETGTFSNVEMFSNNLWYPHYSPHVDGPTSYTPLLVFINTAIKLYRLSCEEFQHINNTLDTDSPLCLTEIWDWEFQQTKSQFDSGVSVRCVVCHVVSACKLSQPLALLKTRLMQGTVVVVWALVTVG